ncbi:TetR/AcrR family transcriptional regulator [Mycobacterium sp.]|uniref:TetR/AcrR family transcriptional regulator n=1 Tax=Mycobacterium sp. TaxID=1785 RepID=UPI003F9A185D
MSESTPQPSSLRAQQVAQTRDSLVRAGRELFGRKGFRQTSVEDLARAARLTTGALYHHFPTKTALFEAVFKHAHTELMTVSMAAAQGATDDLDVLARGFEAFLDSVLEPELQRILILDGPAVLGPARYTELDERYAFAVIVAALRAATEAGTLHVDDPETVTRLLLGALTRGAMLIANSTDPVKTRHAVALSMRTLLSGFVAPASS